MKVGDMTPDNTIRSQNGIDVYEHRIYDLFDEYMQTLSDDPKECDRLIRIDRYFVGALKYIYRHMFRPATVYDIQTAKYCNTTIDISQNDFIDYLWDIYTSLCYKYGNRPSILQFAMMSGISYRSISKWHSSTTDEPLLGECFTISQEDRAAKQNITNKWYEEQHSALYDLAASGNPGGMFHLKNAYGYSDNTRISIEQDGNDMETRLMQAELVRRLTASPNSAITPDQEREAMTITTSTPDPDF